MAKRPKVITVTRQWIASSNAEWLAHAKGVERVRGGHSPARAVSRFAELYPEFFAEGGAVRIDVLPDKTAAQARAAHRAFFGGD